MDFEISESETQAPCAKRSVIENDNDIDHDEEPPLYLSLSLGIVPLAFERWGDDARYQCRLLSKLDL